MIFDADKCTFSARTKQQSISKRFFNGTDRNQAMFLRAFLFAIASLSSYLCATDFL
jgi:hypothetical protein